MAKDHRQQALNAKQEMFAQGVASGLPLAEAYREAGYEAAQGNANWVNATKLRKLPKVALRVTKLVEAKQKAAAANVIVNVQSVSALLVEAFADAKRYKQTGAQVSAAMGIAKLHGLLVDRIEDVTRKPARHPDAPLEIEVEHWLTEHKLLGQPQEPAVQDAQEPRQTSHVDGLPEPQDAPEIVTDAERVKGSGIGQGSNGYGAEQRTKDKPMDHNNDDP
jgi:hypothetical protein